MDNQSIISSLAHSVSQDDSRTISIAELIHHVGTSVGRIEGRVIAKGHRYHYNNDKGSGPMLKFILADKSGKVEVIAWNQICERLFDCVRLNKIYAIHKATVKKADKRYSNDDFGIFLNEDASLEDITNFSMLDEFPFACYNFCSIESLDNIQRNQTFDLIGVIKSMSGVIKAKNKKPDKLIIQITDIYHKCISVTIWDDAANTFKGKPGDILVTTESKVGTYDGDPKTASTHYFFVIPYVPGIEGIQNWIANLLERNSVLTAALDN